MLQVPSDFLLSCDHGALDDLPPNTLQLLFRGSELLVEETGAHAFATCGAPLTGPPLVIGKWKDRVVVAASVARDEAAPPGARWAGLRSLFGTMPDSLVAIAGRATQLVEWDRSHAFCGVCATATEREVHERARKCPSCGHTAYPRISPAMMCLVTRGREILLARNVNFPAGRYSALAGFLEAGENIEDAISREVFEEVGLQVANPRYFASQSWPFPHSLMIAFTAEYAGGILTPNGHEIAEAQWFTRQNLPQMPPRISIARALIEDTLDRVDQQ